MLFSHTMLRKFRFSNISEAICHFSAFGALIALCITVFFCYFYIVFLRMKPDLIFTSDILSIPVHYRNNIPNTSYKFDI